MATTSGYGPRFLHSTGQLHKGGGDNGVFLQLTGGPLTDVPIPGEKFTFGALARAQAIGDFQSLASREPPRAQHRSRRGRRRRTASSSRKR